MPKPSQSAAPTPSASSPDPNADVAALGYEEARDELVAVVARLEAGAATLEESLALWERGEALATRCQEWLDGARERLSAVRDTAARTESGTDESPDDEETR
ncbi:exodeoxyribonuclease VII small subunit [Cellulomonas terrae]|uniref:exodeoxyribonuclease VII small subunit n=1 Tax=Cellulomonas terrae TaxID=311234 RepID=UPI0011BD6F0F|nr:exodeoxyribonuclease VII small subunit [Cellulomonas terrae]